MSSTTSSSSSSSSSLLANYHIFRGWGVSTHTCIAHGNIQKIHYSFRSGEMVEEYNLDTQTLTSRKHRTKSSMGAWSSWTYEIGEPEKSFNPNSDLIGESSLNPYCIRSDSYECFEFRIRNLPYSMDNYIIEVDKNTQEIIVKTLNKKYYKRLTIPDLRACTQPTSDFSKLPDENKLDEKLLNVTHANNTLLIKYKKPAWYKNIELRLLEERKKADITGSKSGENECKTQ